MKVIIEIREDDGETVFLASAPTVDMAIEKLGAYERTHAIV